MLSYQGAKHIKTAVRNACTLCLTSSTSTTQAKKTCSMAVATVVALAALFQPLVASRVPSHPNAACAVFTLPVPVSVQQPVYDIAHVDNDIEATQFAINADTWSFPQPSERVVNNITIDETFDISVQLCVPDEQAKRSSLHLATHGWVFDKRYWDVIVNPSEYSYVQAALDNGYSILTYDRLGTGLSDKPNAYTTVQFPVEIAILSKMTELARTGTILTLAKKSNHALPHVTFEKVIHVGHSTGTFLSSAVISLFPGLSDAAVLTGLPPNKYLNALKATSIGFKRPRGSWPSGYIAGDGRAFQVGFFSDRRNASGFGGFEPGLLEYGNSIQQPITVGEVSFERRTC